MRLKESFLFNNKLRSRLIILLLSIVSALFRYSALPEAPFQWHFFTFWVFLILLLLVWEIFRLIDQQLNKHYPYRRGIAKRISLQISLSVLCMAVLRNIWILALEDNVPELIPHELVVIFYARPFRYIMFLLDTLIAITVCGNFIAMHFFTEWKKSLIRIERIEKERALVQFDNLKNQLNPHFLFNSLSSLNSLIFENQQLASDFLQQLSKVYRYVLQYKDGELVKLETEIQFIRHYTKLLQTRFSKYLNFSISLSEEALERKIVPVTLQVLIENAIKHNIISEQKPLSIHIYDEGEYLVVKNSLQIKNIVESSNKVGLQNMKNLYAFLSNTPFQINREQQFFTVKVPLLD